MQIGGIFYIHTCILAFNNTTKAHSGIENKSVPIINCLFFVSGGNLFMER